MKYTTLFTEEDLKMLFPSQIQRDIFINGMDKLINIIVERTVIVPFVQMECGEIE